MKKIETNKSIMVALSLILALAILFSNIGLFPSAIFADTTEATEAVKSGAVIVNEDETKRGEYERHYLTEDGSYVAISYSDPVNYLDDDGTWKAVDNSLSGNIFTGTLSTNNDKFKVKFANKADHDKLVSVKSDTYDISWGLTVSTDGESYGELDKIKVSADTKNTNSLPKTVSEASSLGAAVSTATYENAYGDAVDIRYTVTHQRVKEDVILKKPSDIVSYKATYNIKGEFNATMNPDGSVTVTDTEGETLFVIGAPWMYDAAGATTDDIAVSVVKSDKNLEVEYRLPKAWLTAPERVYPVTVDPEVTDSEREVSSRLTTSNIDDVSLYCSGVTSSTSHLSAYNSLGMDYELYLKIYSPPSIPSDAEHLGTAFVLYSNVYRNEHEGEEWAKVENLRIKFTEILSDWYPDAFGEYNLDDGYSGFGPIYNYDWTMQFGDVIIEEGIDSISIVESNGLYKIEAELSENEFENTSYNEYFNSYKGFRIWLSYYMRMEIVSSENTTYSKYRPAVVARYSYASPPSIHSGEYGILKNVGSSRYLTIDGEGSGAGANIYQDIRNNIGNQVVRFSYNVLNAYYMIIPIYNSSVYVGYSDAITEPQNTYENVKLVTSGGVSRRWLLVPDGDSYYIFSELDHDHVMTAQGTESGSASTTGMVGGNIFVNYFSEGNNFQKWKFETVNTRNIANVTEPIYMQQGEMLYLQAPEPNVTWESSNESMAKVSSLGGVQLLSCGTAVITADDPSTTITNDYSIEIRIILSDGLYYILNKNGKYIDGSENTVLINNFNTDITQLWYISRLNDYNEEYKIQWIGSYTKYPNLNTAKLLSVNASNVYSQTAGILIEDPSGANLPDRQIWNISMTAAGNFKIKAKSSIGCSQDIALGSSSSQSGIPLTQKVYNGSDDAYFDEWIIAPYQEYAKVTMLTVDSNLSTENDHVDDVTYALTPQSYYPHEISNPFSDNFSYTEILNYLKNTEIFIFDGHGAKGGLLLSWYAKEEDMYTSGDDCYFLIEHLTDVDLSHIKLVILYTCSTAEGFYQNQTVTRNSINNLGESAPNNLMQAFVESGVQNILAFNGKIGEIDALWFIEALFYYLTNKNMPLDDALTLTEAAEITAANVTFLETNFEAMWVTGGEMYAFPLFPECFENGGE